MPFCEGSLFVKDSTARPLKTKPPASPSLPSRRLGMRDVQLGALLFGILLFVYLPALQGGFLWDDDAHITLPELQSLSGLGRIWFQLGATQQYYPLLHTAFWIEHGLWGNAVLGYHLMNLLEHALAAFLLVAILRRLNLPGAWLAAFLFALHPVQVETVAWISEQKNTLSTVFYLASALIYLRFDRDRKRADYWIGFGLFVLALLSKTVTATLPAALLVVFWWRRGRVDWKRDAVPLLPWLALGALAGLFTARVEHNVIGAEGQAFALTLAQKGLLAGRVICFYASKLFWPANLTFIYPHWDVDLHAQWQYLFPSAVIVVVAMLAFVARKHRGPLAGFLFFVGTLFPVLGLLNVYPFRFSYVADHFQYVACLGIIVPIAAGLALAGRKLSGSSRRIATWGGPALVFALAILSWNLAGFYGDGETLYRETLARNPESWLAHSNLGSVLMQRGQAPAAMMELENALQLNPDLAEAHNNVGLLLSDIPGQKKQAIAEFHVALKIRPNYAEAHNNLGALLAEDPDLLQDAIAEYREALRIRPRYAEAHNNLGSALSHLGRPQDGMNEFEEALRLNPNLAEAHANLGVALMKIPGRMPEAVFHLQTALQIRPDMQRVRQILAQVQAQGAGR
jgi:protein O-mannosyl-transferase